MQSPIIFIDFIIILAYILAVLVLGLYFKNSDRTISEYFLADRKVGWLAIGITLFATNISSEHLLGLAGGGAARGLAIAQFELIAIFFLILLGWFIAPVFIRSGAITTPEFLGKRYGRTNQKFFSGLSIFTYFVTKIFVTLFAAGIVFNKIFGLSIFTTSIVIVFLTGVYTLVGGFKAVVRTQVFQGIVLIIGAVVLTTFGMIEVGGLSGLRERIPVEHFQMFKAVNDPDFPWTGIFFGAPIIAFWYWCTDQYVVQRILGAKSIEHARKGTIVASLLKILPLFILVMPGLIALAISPDIQGDEAFPFLISSQVLPNGFKGLVIAGFLAAIMSSLSASFNSIATLYTIDFYKPKHPDASERTLVLVGRMATIAVVFIVIIFVPFIKLVNSHIYLFLQSTQAFLSAPISSVFLFGFLFKKIDPKSVIISLIVGEFFGAARFILEFMANSGMISNQFLLAYTQINYLHFTVYLFVGTSLLLLVLSYIFRIGGEFASSRLSFGISINLLSSKKKVLSLTNERIQILLSFFILLVTISIWYMFV